MSTIKVILFCLIGVAFFACAITAEHLVTKRTQVEEEYINRIPGRIINPISIATLILGGVIGVFCVSKYENYCEAVLIILFMAILAAVTLIDIDIMEIPEFLWISIGVVTIAGMFIVPWGDYLSRIIGIFVISVPMLILAAVIDGAFGGGDIKLMAAGGFFLGLKSVVLATFIGIVLGGIYGIILLATKKKGGGEHFAFGPFLCAGMAVACLWGNEIISSYFSLLGF